MQLTIQLRRIFTLAGLSLLISPTFAEYDYAQPDNAPAISGASAAPWDELIEGNRTASKTPVLSNDLWQRVRSGLRLPELDSPLVADHERWYSARPDYVRRMVDRSSRYLFHVVTEVEKRGMPMEVALLPMIESAYNPRAYSKSHASGIWQFIPGTGKDYGLAQNWWYDGRRDVISATNAALNYLEKLYAMFGDWQLALAAYNWGEGAVSRAIARNEAAGLPTDYLSLNMPAETRNYVPKLMAVRNIVMNPARYNLELASVPNEPYFERVVFERHMDIKVAAQLAGISVEEFGMLNPAYNRPVLTLDGHRTILLPRDRVASFKANVAEYRKPLVSWQGYEAAKGEKLDSIAKRFKTTIAAIRQHNDALLLRKNRLAEAQMLLIPLRDSNSQQVAVSSSKSEPPKASDEGPKAVARYTIRAGDTLFSIASRHGMSLDALKTANNLQSDNVIVGQTLRVHDTGAQVSDVKIAANSIEPESKSEKTAKKDGGKKNESAKKNAPSHYTVRPGDTLYSIARKFNVAVDDIQKWNKMRTRTHIQPGDQVKVAAL